MRGSSLTLWTLAAVTATLLAAPLRADDSIDQLQEQAVKEAVRRVAPSVVKIETSGGTEVIRAGRGPRGSVIRRGMGPTTGVIVTPEGHILSSAFNFANKPATIRVALPGLNERRVARVIATDQTRMLTLLKVVDLPAGSKLAVPAAVPRAEMVIGQTAIAVGRTLASETDSPPSVSVGILSALDRIWGKAIQTDAKVSPTNYGGPLIDLQGRVQGILVPASPQAEGETAGFEWYDSGIGFAIPLADVNAALPRMLKGTEKEPVVLKRGFLGVTMRSTDMYEAVPTIGTILPGSAAEKAGLKTGDVVKAIDGKAISNYAQMQHLLGKRYEGDAVALKVERDKKEVEIARIVLGAPDVVAPPAFLGILPLRDDPDPGVEVRFVYPNSPAEKVGLKAGDRIMKIGPGGGVAPMPMPMPMPRGGMAPPMLPITRGRDQLLTLLDSLRPGQDLKLEVKRKEGGKVETLTARLAAMPDSVPASLPETASAKKALTRPGVKPPAKAPANPVKPAKVETGLLKKTSPAADHTYWIYVPENYDPNIACSVVVWFHPLGKNKERDFEDLASSWGTYCDDHNVILICPQSDNPRGWTPGEADFVVEAVRTVASSYTVDMQRVVAHGMGVGGEMALYMGFQARSLIRGVAVVGAGLSSNPREREGNQSLSFFLVVGGLDPVKPAVVQTQEKLTQLKYPVIFREIATMGHEYIDGKAGVPTLEELVRWLDSLDRI